jgi:hypothetical protein
MKQNAETWNGRIAQVCCEKEKRDLIAASIQLNSKRLI